MKYSIDGRPVTPEAYQAFLAALQVVPGTWYCDDREDGGATGHEARHPDGRVFHVCEDSADGSSITLVPP